jgi:hypothetical protein
MMSLGGKLTALVCHPTKFVNKAVLFEQRYLPLRGADWKSSSETNTLNLILPLC